MQCSEDWIMGHVVASVRRLYGQGVFSIHSKGSEKDVNWAALYKYKLHAVKQT